MNALLIALPLLIGSCSDDNNSYNDPATVPTDIIQTVVKTTDNISIGVSTDKAAYKPGETVRFTVTDGTLPSSAHVRYRHGADVIADENIGSTSWTWTAPQADYTGYMADIYTVDGNDQQTGGCVKTLLFYKNHKALTFTSQGFAMSKSCCNFRP